MSVINPALRVSGTGILPVLTRKMRLPHSNCVTFRVIASERGTLSSVNATIGTRGP